MQEDAPRSTHPPNIKQLNQKSRYNLVVSEIVWTERKYVHGLENFSALKRLVQEQAILSADKVGQIFGNVDDILDFHKRLLARFESTSALPARDQDWSRAFCMFSDAPDMYVHYIANHKDHIEAAMQEHGKLAAATGPAQVLRQVADRCMIDHTFQWPYSRFVKYSCFIKVRKFMPSSCHCSDEKLGPAQRNQRP
jgi:hypothetical protein